MDSSVKTVDVQSSSMSRDGDCKLRLFEKIVYFASGSIGDEALLALKNSNAEQTCLLSDSVTHCIVGKNYIEADVSAARELYDVTTVTPEWIRMSVLCNQLLPTKPFNPFEDNLFSGIVVCVSKLTANDCKTLWALVTYNGGKFRFTLDLNKTTHLIVTKPSGKKYDAVLLNGSGKVKIVTPDWITDCLKSKELCSETNYHPRLLVLPKLPPTNQSFKLQTSGLSTITGFADFDAPIEQSGAVVPKNQGLEQLKQRLPWNQPSTPLTSQPIQTSSPQISQVTVQSNNTHPKQMMSLMSTPQLQRLSQQQVQQLQLQQQTHANNQLLSQQQMHLPQQQNQFQQQIRTQQMQQSKQIQLQHGQQLQFQSNQQMQQSHLQLQQGQQTHLQMIQKGQQQTLQQNQQHIQMQQKVQHLQSGQQLQNQQQQVTLQQQNIQLQQGQPQQQNIQQHQSSQQPTLIPQLQQQTVQTQQGQLPQLQQQTVPIQQGQQQQPQVQMPQLQQQTVQLQQGQQQPGQLSQLQKQTVQLQQNQSHPNQVQQGQQIQQIQPQQIQFQTGNGQQVQFPQQQVASNSQVHIQQQSQIQNVQSTQSSQICIVSNGQQLQQTQANPSSQQQQHLIQQQQQRLMFQQRIVQQGGGTVSTQWRMAHSSSNMPRVQVNQQQSQQIPQQQTLVIGQQPTGNMNTANTQPTTQTQWPQQQTLTIQRSVQQPIDQRQVIWSQQSSHGPQQMIHMDAKTHQQIQAMNPAERLAFINKLTKQRNLVLQQFNARQQQAAGIAGGTNIVRPSTPNGQTTVIRTVNHQLISASGMTQSQQAQWNQIRQQQLLAQQQQQQQMAGGTVTTGLPTSVKSVTNALVNNQQVAQPQTTVWQQSTVTEQGHQQTTGSMSAAQLAQLHQRQQQLQQLRLQQLQMDATQKQQSMQQQVVPNQPIAGVMQSNVNVVQSPQVATAQTSIVQSQQTPTLSTNEQTETQTPSQESFAQTSQSNQQALVVNPKTKTALANMLSIRLQNGISSSTSTQQQQMTGQEISAAGQLRLMTAQHHAAQHQNQQQGTAQGTYQSRTVLNNVTNNAASNRAAQVVGRATAQAAAPNKTLPANYNQSAAVRVAAVLAKSAAGQTVGHQQLPHQARFFGHNPNLKLPPEKCLLGCIFLIVEYDRSPDTNNDVSTWKRIILDHGGEIEPSYTLRLTHILCQTQKHPLVQQGLRDGKRCITAYWLSDIITKQQLMPPWYALHFPTPYSEERPCRQMLISLTNFEGEERNRVKFMIELTGARVTSYFSAENNILVTKKLDGKKVKKARDTNRPVVNVQWLNEILFGHLSCMYQPENTKYQQFNLNNPFRVDYNLVLHLMGAWKMPINITQESYDRVRNNPVPIKRKRPRPSLQDFMDQENNDLSTADIIITNINPPPIEYRPCVMLSGFGLGKEEQRMVLQLGGSISKNYSDATHLVMKEPVRTTKFLCCVSTVKHIVTADWLKDSSTQHMFLGEAIYTVEEISVDQKVICKVHKILSNPNRHELFKGKIFFVTPGVTRPSVFVVRQIIESAGGTIEKQRRSLRAIQELEPNTYIVVASNNDLHLVADLIRSSYGIYSSEFVLSAVMTQYVNYDMAYKKTKKIIG